MAFLCYGQTQWAGFIQDDWRVAPHFTANLGVRYEYQSITDDLNNFGPRLGFAYDVGGKGTWIIRGGAAMYYDQPFFHGLTEKYLLDGVYAYAPTYTLVWGDPGFPLSRTHWRLRLFPPFHKLRCAAILTFAERSC